MRNPFCLTAGTPRYATGANPWYTTGMTAYRMTSDNAHDSDPASAPTGLPMYSAASDPDTVVENRPWKDLPTTADVEQWIADYDQALQQLVQPTRASGCGICFTLDAGGEIFLHTNGDGDVVLDVTPDAAWAAPVISAATRTAAPPSQLWVLSGDTLTQLVLGLNSMIASSRIVTSHNFRARHL